MWAIVQWIAALCLCLGMVSCGGQNGVSCDVGKIANLVDWNLANGSWFLKMHWTNSPRLDFVASEVNMILTENQGQRQILWQETLVRAGSQKCETLTATLDTVSAVIQHPQIPGLSFAFVAADESVGVVWIQYGPFSSLRIYSRSPNGIPAVSRCQSPAGRPLWTGRRGPLFRGLHSLPPLRARTCLFHCAHAGLSHLGGESPEEWHGIWKRMRGWVRGWTEKVVVVVEC